jgi:hypothetical protein
MVQVYSKRKCSHFTTAGASDIRVHRDETWQSTAQVVVFSDTIKHTLWQAEQVYFTI